MTTKSKQHELRDKFRSLPRTDRLDPRYPIDAYEDDLVTLINSEVHSVLEELEKHSDGNPCTVRYSDGSVERMRIVPLSAIQTLKEKYKS